MNEGKTDTLWLRIVLGAFAVCILVNVAFLVVAMKNSTALVHANAYERGVAYQDTIDARARLRDTGWTVSVRADDCRISVSIVDSSGHNVIPSGIWLEMVKPDDEAADFSERLSVDGERFVSSKRPMVRGRWMYEAAISLPGGKLGEASGGVFLDTAC